MEKLAYPRKMNVKRNLLLWLFNNSPKIIGIGAAVFGVAIVIAKFVGYLYSIGKFNAFGIELSYFDWNDGYSIIYQGFICIMVLLFLIFMGFLMQKVKDNFKSTLKMILWVILILIINFIVCNIIIGSYPFYDNSFYKKYVLVFGIIFFALLLFEFLINCAVYEFLFMETNKVIKKHTNKTGWVVWLFISFISFCIGIYRLGYLSATLPGETRFYGEEVIIYTNKNYILTSDYIKFNQNLLIDKNKIHKVVTSNKDVEIITDYIFYKEIVNFSLPYK